ncbi:MAG: hypothetical protein M3X11_11375, partial [Acidobacteriota bacterium]|nr:hypothetical protein [Acidobacteriota bacterium]
MKPQKARQRLNGRQYFVGLPCLLLFLVGCAARSSQPSQPSIRWTADAADASKVVVEVYGLSAAALERVQQSNWEPAQWQRLLSVFAESGNAAINQSLPPMLGSYRVQANVLRFEPQFPLEPGVSYRAVFHP